MTITLRPYQQQIIDGIQKLWQKGLKRLLVFSCTRSGKTVVFSYLAKKMNDNGKRVLILTNRKTLFKQTGSSITDFGITPFFINAETKTIRDDSLCYLGMLQTILSRIDNPKTIKFLQSIDVIIADECHVSQFDKLLLNPIFKDKFILGFSGSPVRSGAMPELAGVYQQIVLGPYTADLEPKWCKPARFFEVEQVDMSGVSKSGGEFNQEETFKRFDTAKLYRGAVHNWKLRAENRCTLTYCVSIMHALKTAIEFNNAGIKTKYISSGKAVPKLKDNPNKGDLTKYRLACEDYELIQNNLHLTGDTDTIIQEWRNDEFINLINVGILSFGFNEPKIMVINWLKATLSLPNFLQGINRGGTPMDGKDYFIVLDYGGSSDRLGEYNERHEWSLFHKKPSGQGGVMATKECIKCGGLIRISARVCDEDWGCGTEQPKSAEQKEVELVERKMSNKNFRDGVDDLETIEEIEQLAKVRNYKKTWLFRTIYFKFGEDEFKAYMKEKYKWAYIYRLIDQYSK